jgi:hypothetical protein
VAVSIRPFALPVPFRLGLPHPVSQANRAIPPERAGRIASWAEDAMELTISTGAIPAIVALIAGILILIVPRLLNYVVAIYLIIIGLLGLFPTALG